MIDSQNLKIKKRSTILSILTCFNFLTSWIQCLRYSSQILSAFTHDSRLNTTAYIPFKIKNIQKPPAVLLGSLCHSELFRPPAIPNFFFPKRVRVSQFQLLNQTFRLKTNYLMLIFH